MQAVIDILVMLFGAVRVLVIVWFIIGLLFAFNVVNRSNEFLSQVEQSLSALFAPVLDPIRRILPKTGAIDFSPIVLLLLLMAIVRLLQEAKLYV